MVMQSRHVEMFQANAGEESGPGKLFFIEIWLWILHLQKNINTSPFIVKGYKK